VNEFSFHSIKVPTKIISRRINEVKNQFFKFKLNRVIKIGKMMAISTSKMMNKIAIKKNRMENGI